MRGSRTGPLLGLFCLLCAIACTPDSEPEPDRDLAVLAASAEEYLQARRGRALRFPADHGHHPGFRIEWWYLTANLRDDRGRAFGAQWTLFRTATVPPGEETGSNPWHDPQVYMAHMAVTTPADHVAFQRYARGGDHGGISRAGVNTHPFAAWLDDWTLHSTGSAWLPLELHARQDPYAIRLQLDSDLGPVLQGDAGFSQKHPAGGGSHYYSHPYLQASGELQAAGERIEVTGQAWLDREWSSQFLGDDQAGWDWFALHLDSGEKLMLARIRSRTGAGGTGELIHGVLFSPRAEKTVLDPARIDLSVRDWRTVAGRRLPLAWSIALPEIGRRMEIEALHPDQWMDLDFPYWEGAVTVRGAGPRNRGQGYLELSGYSLEQ